jgi:hypothetical protein
MDRTHALAALNGKIMAAYSRRTIEALRAALPLRVALPHLEPVLALNLDKEVRKDALVIQYAGEARTAGSAPGREAIQQLFDATRAVDRMFLERVGAFPVRIVIRYEEIAPVRMERIERLLRAAYRILVAWHTGMGLRAALRATYPQPDLDRLLHEMLRLYAMETRALSRSVRLPALLTPVRERVAQGLFTIMNDVATRLTTELVHTVYRSDRDARRRDGPAG